LLDYVVFADWIFFGSTAATLFVLRRRDAERDAQRERGERSVVTAPGHPFTTLIFIAAAVYVVVGSIISNPGNAARGAGLLALGVPVYLYWNGRRTAPRPSATP
jgi:APA family basic amino acid/polyamine antiporter